MLLLKGTGSISQTKEENSNCLIVYTGKLPTFLQQEAVRFRNEAVHEVTLKLHLGLALTSGLKAGRPGSSLGRH